MNTRRVAGCAGSALALLGTRFAAAPRPSEDEAVARVADRSAKLEADERTLALSELADLDAIASPRGAVPALRICGPGELEPALLTLSSAGGVGADGGILIEVVSTDGRELERYAVPRARLKRALDDAEAAAPTRRRSAQGPSSLAASGKTSAIV